MNALDTATASQIADTAATSNKAAALKNAKDRAALEQAAQEFEAVFVTQMLKPMFEGIKTDARFGGGKGEEIFRGFMLEEYGKMIAARGDLGIADAIKTEMLRMQAEQSGQTILPKDLDSNLNAPAATQENKAYEFSALLADTASGTLFAETI